MRTLLLGLVVGLLLVIWSQATAAESLEVLEEKFKVCMTKAY